MKKRTMMKTQKNTKHPLRLVHLGPAFHQDGDNNNNSNNNHKNNDNNDNIDDNNNNKKQQ